MAPADRDGNSSDDAPMEDGKVQLTNPSRIKEPGASQQRIIVTQKPGEKKKKKIKWTPPEAADVGSSASTMTTKSSSPHDGEEQQWQPSMLPVGSEAQQQGPGKRPRLVWTPELHDKFVEAHKTLGKDAVPKKILDLMNDPRLTRGNVASHLQKYRLSLQRSGKPVGTRARGNATVTRIHHRAQTLQADPPAATSPALHRTPLGPFFATPIMSLDSQPQQRGHGQLVQTLPNRYSGNAPNLLHRYLNLPVVRPKLLNQHMNLPVAQPMPMQDLFNPVMLRVAAATKHMLVTDQQAQQAARMQQAAAAAPASGYNHMPVRNYLFDVQMETRAPVASGVLINHRPEPPTQAFQATNVIREHSAPEVNVGAEGTVTRTVKAETGQKCAAEPPAAAASADPERSHHDELIDDVEQYLNSEPPWGYSFPSKDT